MRPDSIVLRRAEIVPSAVRYQVLVNVAASAASILLIPLLPFIAPLVAAYYRRYYRSLEVVLTTRELHVKRGVMIRQEKSIPLEKITDLAVFQGPIMRRMGLKGIQVETAGQTTTGTALVKIVGLVDTDGFRDAVLDQRDKIAPGPSDAAPLPAGGVEGQLARIHETLLRIEDALTRPRQPG